MQKRQIRLKCEAMAMGFIISNISLEGDQCVCVAPFRLTFYILSAVSLSNTINSSMEIGF